MAVSWASCCIILFSILVNSQSLPQLEHRSKVLPNNSYINYARISVGEGSLKCVTDSVNCCSDSAVGNWRDEKGGAVQQGANETTCLYVTRGQGEVSLNRNNSSDCIPERSGLWRCDGPDSRESIYIYISTTDAYSEQFFEFAVKAYDCLTGDLQLSPVKFTLHTEVSISPPEFTVAYRTKGGPATNVSWTYVGGLPEDHEQSQIILDTSQNSVYENRLRVRGRESGNYTCNIQNAVDVKIAVIKIKGLLTASLASYVSEMYSCRRALQSDCCHLSVQQYTFEYYCVLGVTSHE